MPSGAKKRKAAKKKMKKEAYKNGAHHQGSDDPKSHDERDSDGGEFEREPSEEGALENHEEGAREVSLGEEIAAEIAEEVKIEENLNDVTVEGEDGAGEGQNGDASVEGKSTSGGSSSPDKEEVAVEKEKSVVLESVEVEQQVGSSRPEVLVKENPVVLESVEVEQQVESLLPAVVVPEETPEPLENVPEEAFSIENSAPSEEVDNTIEQSIPVEESVKEVVSLPMESNILAESVPIENKVDSETVEAEPKENVEELLPSSDGKDGISSDVMGLQEEKIETKVTEVVDRGVENFPELADVTEGENEALLPQSSLISIVERNGVNNHAKESELHAYSDEELLVSSASLPVQRTSLMGCCGLLEVFSGGRGSSR